MSKEITDKMLETKKESGMTISEKKLKVKQDKEWHYIKIKGIAIS